jgi:diguanylate cyclase (GGDEF)-like protein
MNQIRLKLGKRLIPGCVTALIFALLFQSAALMPLEHMVYRLLFLLRGEQHWDPRLVLIAIDDPSLEVMGRFPWPREFYTQLLHTLIPSKPNVVVFNLIWSETSGEDRDLAAMFQNHGGVILAEAWDAQGRARPPVPLLQQNARGVGHVMKEIDGDGIVRQVYPWLDQEPALGLAAIAAYQAHLNLHIPPPQTGTPLWINWPGRSESLTRYSFADVLAGKVPAAAFQDKIILVGVTAVGMDPLVTPYRQSISDSGVYLHAAVIQNLLHQNFLKPIGWQALPFLIAFAPLLNWLLIQQSMRSQFGLVVVMLLTWMVLGLGCFQLNIWIPIAMPLALIGGTSMLTFCAERWRENILLKAEIVQRKRVEMELRYNLCHDDLTGLLNRRGFLECLEQSLLKLQEDRESSVVVYFLDLDRFKLINDAFGHFAGDQLLKQAADRLKDCLPGAKHIARFGGDEFAILLETLDDREAIVAVAQEIHKTLLLPSFINEQIIFMDASIGIVIVDSHDHQSAEHTIRDADIAMYVAKAKHEGHVIFQPVMQEAAYSSLTLEMELRQAIADQALQIYYQPIVDLTTGSIVGFESLLRWFHPQQGFISPLQFIPIAEETNLIIKLGEWAFLESCKTLKSWQDLKLISPQAFISVNLSVKQFTETRLTLPSEFLRRNTNLSPCPLA